MAFPVIAAIAAQQGADVVSNGVSMMMQNHFMRQNMARQQAYSVENQIDAPVRYSSGLIKAGLPVNLALNGAFQTSSAPSASPPSPHSVDISSLLLSASQSDLLSAEAKNKEIEADIKEVQLNRMQSEDKSLNESLRDYYSTMAKIEPDKAEFWNARAKATNDYDAGSLKAIRDFDDNLAHRSDVDLRLLDNKVQFRVKKMQEMDNGVLAALAKSPQDNRIAIYKTLAKNEAEISRMASQNLKDESDIAKANVEAKKILSDIDHAYNSDLVANVRNGDYVGALLILGSTIAKEASAGAGAAAVGAATRNPSGAVAGYRNARARAQERAYPFPR
jgi:hypothetical protein